MTVGEKIQYYRKKAGLSQEELGQRLLVSRQTVSLWEMDKTLPTVDNLIRIKEVFSVGIDELLSEGEPAEVQEQPTAAEEYSFAYTKDTLSRAYKLFSAPLRRRFIIFLIISVILFFLTIGTDGTDFIDNLVLGFIIGYFAIGLFSNIKAYLAYKKLWRAREERLLASRYRAEIFDGYMMLYTYRDEELTRTQKVLFDDIENVRQLGAFFIIEISAECYIIDKSDVAETSILYSLCRKHAEKSHRRRLSVPLRIVSIVLMVLSIMTIFYGIAAVGVFTAVFGNVMYSEQFMWVLYLFLPIPIASVIFGFIMKKKGFKYKKNVIAGFIMIGVLVLYGSFTFIFEGMLSHSDEQLLRVEALLELEIPEPLRINYIDYSEEGSELHSGQSLATSDVMFTEATASQYEELLSDDERWLSGLPSSLACLASDTIYDFYDYYIIYNVDTGEINELPERTDTYRFINICYSCDSNYLVIVEYSKDYIAE